MIKNAQIDKTKLGMEEGYFTCWLFLSYGASHSQGFGGYGLGDKWCSSFIKEILKVAGVEDWEELSGRMIRVELDTDDFSGKIIKIGNILDDVWFDPKELAKKLGVDK